MDRAECERLIAQYAQGYDAVAAALAGIADAEWDAREAPGEWSPRQVVHHLAESETTATDRLRRLLAADEPLILGYDENAYAARLWYDRRPLDASLAAFKAARDLMLPILRLMDDADWARAGRHSDAGPYTAADWLAIYGVHAHDHADQIRRARAAWAAAATDRA